MAKTPSLARGYLKDPSTTLAGGKALPIVDEAEIEDDDEDKDDVGNLRDFNSKFNPFRDNLTGNLDNDDTKSVRSVSTTASTIHPDVVKARVKASLEKSKKKNQARRTVSVIYKSFELIHFF